jgi:uncharacterized protein YneF (UPF0154 family)
LQRITRPHLRKFFPLREEASNLEQYIPIQWRINCKDAINITNFARLLSFIYSFGGFFIASSNIEKLAKKYPSINNVYLLRFLEAFFGSANAYSNFIFVDKLSPLLSKIYESLSNIRGNYLPPEVALAVIYGLLGIISTIPSSTRILTADILPDEVNNILACIITTALLPVYSQDFLEFYKDAKNFFKTNYTNLKQEGVILFTKSKLNNICNNKLEIASKSLLSVMGGFYVMSYVSVTKQFSTLNKVPSMLFIAARIPFICEAVNNTVAAIKDPHFAHKSLRFLFDVIMVLANAIATTLIYIANTNLKDPNFSPALFGAIAISTLIFSVLHRFKNVLKPAQRTDTSSSFSSTTEGSQNNDDLEAQQNNSFIAPSSPSSKSSSTDNSIKENLPSSSQTKPSSSIILEEMVKVIHLTTVTPSSKLKMTA